MPVRDRGYRQMQPTRFPGGINNVYPTETFANLGKPDPTLFHAFFTDYDTYPAADYTTTLVGAGTSAATAGQGGLLVLTTTAGATDSIYSQFVRATFQPVMNKRTFFKIKFQLDNNLAALQFGLIIPDTTPLDATDGIYFLKAANTAVVQAFVRKDATTGSSTIADLGVPLVPATYTVWGFEWNGKDRTTFYINEQLIGSIPTSATNLPDALLTVSFGILNSTTVARVLTIDYICVEQER